MGCRYHLFLLAISVILMQSGCSAKSAYTGHAATNLSWLHFGLSRAEVEETLGPPEKVESLNDGAKSWHIYDRGFVGSLETESIGEKIAWTPIMVWGELVSLGIVELMIRCQVPCQKGLLEIVYDDSGHLLTTTENFLPDNHPELNNCTTTAVRADVAICQGVREKVRPSSVPQP